MTTVALRGLAGRKLRAILTALAIVLGVAMISGTYVLTDTIDKAFNNIFTQAYAGSDAVITGQEAFSTDTSQPPPFSQTLLPKVRALPSVAAAVGGVSDTAQLTKKNGDLIETHGAPALAFGVDFTQARFNPLTLVTGSWPTGSGQIVIDQGAAEDGGYKVGDSIGVVAKGPVQQLTIVGIVKYGSVSSIGSATISGFTLPDAQRLFDKVGKLDGIQVAGSSGVTPQQLVRDIEPILPAGTKVQTGQQEAQDQTKDIEDFTKFIRYFLLAFGFIALFVGAFVIFNTLSITVAQRVREFGTLRTLGASRRQVLRSVILEALVIGLLASVVGLFLGLGLAAGLKAVLASFGLDLPSTGTQFLGRTIIVSLLAGVLITVIAGIIPAIRATRVPPIAAVREGATLPRSRFAKWSIYLAVLTTLIGLALLLYGVFVHGIGVGQRLSTIGFGCVILFIGVALVSPRLVRPLARVLGAPGERMGGAAGRLAKENAMRNPGRTAATAAALMIGLALIAFVAILAQGLRSSVRDAIDNQVSADFVVTSDDNFTPFEPSADAALAAVPGAKVVGIRGDRAKFFGSEQNVTGVDPATIGSVYSFDWSQGSDAVLSTLGPRGALVEKDFAKDHNLAPGSPMTMLTPSGNRVALIVRATFDQPPFWEMLGKVAIPTETFDQAFEDPRNLYSFVVMPGGPTPENKQTLSAALEPFPSVKLDTKSGFVTTQQQAIDPFLNLLYVLLALSVIVSLFGVVNTLVLSVYERTRELGMLRAVGMTRRQVRRMIRHESIITALIGAVLGMVLGIILAVITTQALKNEGVVFAVPVVSLIVFLIVGIVAGMLAAIFPARRASRLNVLEALQYE
jgi:putative ABC transport system permease protein